jgi:hypothetical protein
MHDEFRHLCVCVCVDVTAPRWAVGSDTLGKPCYDSTTRAMANREAVPLTADPTPREASCPLFIESLGGPGFEHNEPLMALAAIDQESEGEVAAAPSAASACAGRDARSGVPPADTDAASMEDTDWVDLEAGHAASRGRRKPLSAASRQLIRLASQRLRRGVSAAAEEKAQQAPAADATTAAAANGYGSVRRKRTGRRERDDGTAFLLKLWKI